MSRYLSRSIKQIEPYIPGEQPKDKKYIKLNTNENPYPPSPKVLEALKNTVDAQLRLYPDPGCEKLNKSIAEFYGVNEKKVFAGNGSDEVLAFAFKAFFDVGDTVIFPDITYSFYPVYSNLFEVKFKEVPLKEDLTVDLQAFLSNSCNVFLPNPNAPTGILLSNDVIEKIAINNPDHVIVVDEAYIDFGGESAIKLVEKYRNLLVVQTFSKSRALAGIRVGFAVGDENLIDGLNRVKNSFNSYTIDRLALEAATAAMNDREYFETTTKRIIDTREWTQNKLIKLGFRLTNSKANFIFVSPPSKILAEKLFKELRQRGILVRYFNKPRINNYLRITIGTNEEMQKLIDEISDIIGDTF